MKSIVNLRGVKATSRRQLIHTFQDRLFDRCHALCQENAQLKAKLAEERNNSASLKKLTVQLQEKVDKINEEFSQSQEDFKTELHLEREKNRLLQEKLERKSAFYQERSRRYESDNIDAIDQAHKLQRELENCVQQHTSLQKDHEELRGACSFSQNSFTAELHAERQKNMVLQEELQRTYASYNEISQRYASDSNNARHELDLLQREHQSSIQQHQVLEKNYAELCAAHTFSQNSLTAELHAERQKNVVLQDELHRTISSCYEMHGQTRRAEADAINDLRAERDALRQQITDSMTCRSPNQKAWPGTIDHNLDTDVDMCDISQ